MAPLASPSCCALRIWRRPGLLCIWCCSVARGHWARQILCCKFVGCFRTYKPQVAPDYVVLASNLEYVSPLTVLQPRLPNSPHATKTKSEFRHGFASGSTLSKPFAYLGNRRAACNCIWIPREAGSGSLIYHLSSFFCLSFCSLLCFSYTMFYLLTCFCALYYPPIRWKVSLGKPLLILTWPTSWATSWSPWGPLNISRVKMPNLSIMPFS